jgi:hypothetical protein
MEETYSQWPSGQSSTLEIVSFPWVRFLNLDDLSACLAGLVSLTLPYLKLAFISQGVRLGLHQHLTPTNRQLRHLLIRVLH